MRMAGIFYMFFLETTKFFRFQLFPKKKKGNIWKRVLPQSTKHDNMIHLQDISKEKAIDDASQDDDDGVSHNVFPLELFQMIVPILVYLASYHDWQSKRT